MQGRSKAELLRMEAVYYWFAFTNGVEQAFTDLTKHAHSHGQAFSPQYYYAAALRRVGQLDEALTIVEKAYSVANSAADRTAAASMKAQLVIAKGSPPLAAARGLADELSKASVPADRARIYRAISDLYKDGDNEEPRMRLTFLEAAIRNDPTNKELLFDTAYAYGDAESSELALLHYRELITIEPSHPNALNNAGVAAERLNYHVKAVQYYKRAESEGEDTGLASANLASRLIGAGFTEEAMARLDATKAKHGSKVNGNVLLNIGKVAETENSDEHNVKEAMNRAQRAAKWRAREAEALLRQNADIVGQFEGADVK